jgi:hypothetical protein
MAAGQGASLRELMERMGHSSPRAALIYLHATRERDQEIAAGMGKLLTQARRKTRRGGDRARNGHADAIRRPEDQLNSGDHAPDLRGNKRAGEGNRTLMTSLEDRWGGPPCHQRERWSR